MASSHHHHHHSHQQIDQCNLSCCNPCCSNVNPGNSTVPPPNGPNPSDQLLQALATSLLLQSQPQFQSPIPPPSIPTNPPLVPSFYSHDHLASNRHPHGSRSLPFPQHKAHNPIPNHIPSHKPIDPLVSLFDRVAALESSLFSNPKPFPAQRSNRAHNSEPYANRYSSNRQASLKDLAARTIQVHFRRFLVRRSQILRDLKRLAVMKCHVASLRSTVSHRAEIDPKMVSDQAADLLLRLESIRSVDPMIYEGKRSIERELVRIVEFVDKIYLREQEIYHNDQNSNRDAAEEAEEEEEEEEEEEIDSSSSEERKLKKKVSFEERGKKPRVFRKEEHGDCFKFPNGVYEMGEEMNFEEIEKGFGKMSGKKFSGLAPPLPPQMEMRKPGGRREK